MAESSGEPKQRDALELTDVQLKEHIAVIDRRTTSPEQRALKVYQYLRENPAFTTWDILCFCANWLGIMSAVWSWVENPAKVLSQLVYKAHYFFTDRVLGEEGKL